MRTSLTVAIMALVAKQHNIEVVCSQSIENDATCGWFEREREQRSAPHWQTRAQYKKLVLPKRSRKSKRR
ncbi:hypothetical protein JA13_258 [Dickeya phage vB_DsoM_JA13]|uniref:Uncharacterized protein n=1 Tax=Dickeya phage vB_DsoM_JA13 TaxID=2283030 RepID=A0A384ZWP9_9CAUD|nr:hypothetical protein JA13_258 [Dickeya phage vB_DsoM_JA13]